MSEYICICTFFHPRSLLISAAIDNFMNTNISEYIHAVLYMYEYIHLNTYMQVVD
jgi:hypothetical protein